MNPGSGRADHDLFTGVSVSLGCNLAGVDPYARSVFAIYDHVQLGQLRWRGKRSGARRRPDAEAVREGDRDSGLGRRHVTANCSARRTIGGRFSRGPIALESVLRRDRRWTTSSWPIRGPGPSRARSSPTRMRSASRTTSFSAAIYAPAESAARRGPAPRPFSNALLGAPCPECPSTPLRAAGQPARRGSSTRRAGFSPVENGGGRSLRRAGIVTGAPLRAGRPNRRLVSRSSIRDAPLTTLPTSPS